MSLRIRRGGTTTSGGGSGATYGPTDGAASVRSGVGARTVSSPGGGISFNSSASLQTAIDNNPSASTFICSVNNPTWTQNVDTGTKAPTIIFPGTVGQKVIDGGNNSFGAITLGPNATLSGGTWQNFGAGASGIMHCIFAGDFATVTDVVVTGAKYSGVALTGPNVHVSYSNLNDNGLSGYQGGTTCDNTVIDHCEVARNNASLFSPGNEGGAGKMAGTNVIAPDNGWFHHNWLYGNFGFSMWWDTQCEGWTIEENVSENNERCGFFYEASRGGTIRRNYIANNGRSTTIGGQLHSFENCVNARIADCNATQGSGSPVSFTRNILDHTLAQTGNLGGLLLLWDHNGTTFRSVQNVDVYENQFWLRGTLDQRVGGEDTAPTAFPVWSSDNHFFSNEYQVASTAISYWKWDTGTGTGVATNFSTWQGYHPTGETRLVI